VDFTELSYTSLKQTGNDLLRDYDRIDEQSLAQTLADYYYANGGNFDGLNVDP
jgi:hypothetical protein